MNEREFRDLIDCRFPYTDERRAMELVETAKDIGPEAAFAVAHELARPGRSAAAPAATRRDLLEALGVGFSHPAKSLVFDVARRMIDEDPLSELEALTAMQALEAHAKLWSALSLIYFSTAAAPASVDRAYEEVKSRWGGDAD